MTGSSYKPGVVDCSTDFDPSTLQGKSVVLTAGRSLSFPREEEFLTKINNRRQWDGISDFEGFCQGWVSL